MWPYAQCNPNKGQGELIKSNSPTSAHQLAPAPLRHAQDLTVMRQATQLIPCPPPPTSTQPQGSGGRCVAPALLPPLSTKPNSTRLTAQPQCDPQHNGCSPRRCPNTSPRRIFFTVTSEKIFLVLKKTGCFCLNITQAQQN